MQIRPRAFSNEKFMKRKFDFLSKFIDVFGCADLIPNVQI